MICQTNNGCVVQEYFPSPLLPPLSPILGSLRYHDGDGGKKHRLKSDSSIYETLVRFSQLGHYVLCKRTLPELNS